MDADYQRFTRLQTFLLICSLFVGCLAAGDLPLFAVRVSPLLVYLIYNRLLYKFPSCRCCRVRLPEFPLGYPGAGRECLAGVSWQVCAGLLVQVLLQAAFAGRRGRGRVCAGLPFLALLQAAFAGRRGRGRGRSAPVGRCLGGCRGQVHLVLLPRQGVIKQACYIIRDTEKWRKERKKTIPEVPAVKRVTEGVRGSFIFVANAIHDSHRRMLR